MAGKTTVVAFTRNPAGGFQVTSNSTTLYTVPASQFGRAVVSAVDTSSLAATFSLDGSAIMQVANVGYSDKRSYWVPTGTTLQWGSVSGTGRYNFVVSLYNS